MKLFFPKSGQPFDPRTEMPNDWQYFIRRLWTFFHDEKETEDQFMARIGINRKDKSDWIREPFPNIGMVKQARINRGLKKRDDLTLELIGWLYHGDGPRPRMNNPSHPSAPTVGRRDKSGLGFAASSMPPLNF
jgi:hypothetical protein